MKIRLKLTLLFSGLFAILLLGFCVMIYYSNANQREEEYFKRLKQLAITKANLLLEAKVPPAVMQLIYKSSLNTLPQEEVAVFDTQYNLLYHDAMYIDRVKETRGMLDSIVALKEIHFYVDDLQAIGFAYSFGGKTYVVTAAAKDDYGLSKLKTLGAALAIGFAIAMVLVWVAGSIFSRKALQPVSTMVDKVGDITASQLGLRIDPGSGKDEIAELAITFNQMLDRLEHSFEAQKQFVSNISHELRTPLAAIIAELEVSAIRERNITEYKEVIRLILGDAKRLSRLSNDLLDLAKASYDQREISFKELRVDEVLLDARSGIIRADAAYNVDIAFDGEIEDGDAITIKGNEYLLKVAFSNLIENACKFSPDKLCRIFIRFMEKKTILSFNDHGIGISPEDLVHIFTPFYRGGNKQYAAGNGIGLSLTAKIISLHNGRISVDSQVNAGTTFTVELSHG